jgi:hypothetical protein
MPATQQTLKSLEIGRSGGIRTHDPLTPSQVRYQAALHSVSISRPGFISFLPLIAQAENLPIRTKMENRTEGGGGEQRAAEKASPMFCFCSKRAAEVKRF